MMMPEFLEYTVRELVRCRPDDEFGRGVWLWDARFSLCPSEWGELLRRTGIDELEALRLLSLVANM